MTTSDLWAKANVWCASELDPPLAEDNGTEDNSDEEMFPIPVSPSMKKMLSWEGTAITVHE